jgi:hypothetical protein
MSANGNGLGEAFAAGVRSPDVGNQISGLASRYSPPVRRRYQLHLWISAGEYTALKQVASERDEAMAQTVRRLIRQLKRSTTNG